ncbi:MAG: hypothetical protein K8R36_14990 [Planctomycetales bacterium]|nr:hypothetical protein [Planctomycetales bacterium]
MQLFTPLIAGMHPILALLLVAVILAVLLTPVYFFMIVPAMKKRAAEEAEKAARIELRGKPVRAWIVVAHDDLYKPRDSDDHRYAQVIYTFEQLPSPDKTLNEIAGRLINYRAGEGSSQDEKTIARVMESHMPYFDPLRLPASVAGKFAVYTVSLRVPWKKLPEKKLTRPYIWCKVLEGERDNVRMTDYPAGG